MPGPLLWVEPDDPLPDAARALLDPPGLVAAGLDLGVERLTQAYSKGLFPWYSQGDPVLWWSPDPRMVLKTSKIHLSKSLGKQLRQVARQQQAGNFRVIVTTDQAFSDVLQGCAQRGESTSDTWITAEMKQAYLQWHAAGAVHSVETWVDGKLAGGLYGVCLGRMFFGESMFTRVSNASKLAFVHLARFLQNQGVPLIDCQMQTEHLASLGAHSVDRHSFINHVTNAVNQPTFDWPVGWLDPQGQHHLHLPAGYSLRPPHFMYDKNP